jgi:hypothetical protein
LEAEAVQRRSDRFFEQERAPERVVCDNAVAMGYFFTGRLSDAFLLYRPV